ncbi:MAG TPA: hypothetical protein VFH51_09715, partial [Myxococcota bacterium]|nr:hypothetical protein [Myxococcota bacterium]
GDDDQTEGARITEAKTRPGGGPICEARQVGGQPDLRRPGDRGHPSDLQGRRPSLKQQGQG